MSNYTTCHSVCQEADCCGGFDCSRGKALFSLWIFANHTPQSAGQKTHHLARAAERIPEEGQRTSGAALDQDAGGQTAGGDEASGAGGRTGWETEREAFFSAQDLSSQSVPAAPASSSVVDPRSTGGLVGDVVQLGHSLECDPSAVRVSDSTTMHQRFDRKTLRTEQEKKITLGHKEDDQEEEQIWQQTADVLEEMIKETRSRLATLMKELEQAKEKAADLKNSAAAVQKEYDKIMSWADLYAGSSIEGKKMILRQLIDRVNIGRDFEIEVEFKISVAQFFDFLHPEGDKSVYYRAS